MAHICVTPNEWPRELKRRFSRIALKSCERLCVSVQQLFVNQTNTNATIITGPCIEIDGDHAHSTSNAEYVFMFWVSPSSCVYAHKMLSNVDVKFLYISRKVRVDI